MATWERREPGRYILTNGGRVLAKVQRRDDRPRKWAVVVEHKGRFKTDPTPFPSAEKAKIVAESWVLGECRECLGNEPLDRMTDGVCEDCYEPDEDDPDYNSDCPECGGSGMT